MMKRAWRVWKLPMNAVADIEKPRQVPKAGIDVLSAEEVMALVRAAETEQDAALFLMARSRVVRESVLVVATRRALASVSGVVPGNRPRRRGPLGRALQA